ncbi:MAG: hypothetical protein SFW35_12840 [Chitinophagales bacterium]|nr:hypothetical protein [Chitinophagales bacterium]
MKHFFIALLLSLATIAISSCKKETDYIYQVNDVDVKQNDGDKTQTKSKEEFISIAYSDITGQSITRSQLENLLLPYEAFGDYKLVEEMIIKSFLNLPEAQVPSNTDMQSDIPKFVNDAYRRFYNRDANEYEVWYIEKYIRENSLDPKLVYYAIMTSNEYRYY